MEQAMFRDLVSGILSVLENRTVRIVLYGSVARKTATAESDIDIAVIMHGTLDSVMEDKLSDIIVDLNIKYDRVFSVVDIDAEQFAKWEKVTPFYQNVNKEGIVLWKAA